jgi:hypothetical protein
MRKKFQVVRIRTQGFSPSVETVVASTNTEKGAVSWMKENIPFDTMHCHRMDRSARLTKNAAKNEALNPPKYYYTIRKVYTVDPWTVGEGQK